MFNIKNLTKKMVVALVAISLVPATSTVALAHGGGGHHHQRRRWTLAPA